MTADEFRAKWDSLPKTFTVEQVREAFCVGRVRALGIIASMEASRDGGLFEYTKQEG